MDEILRDIRFAGRQIFKHKGFAFTAILTLALCIGANTTIFSVVNSVILQPLPFPEPDRLVRMWNSYPNAGAVRGSNGVPDYYDRRALTEVFEEVATYQWSGMSLDLGGAPRRVSAMRVTPSLFPLLRQEAASGRTFTEEEGELDNDRVVLLSNGLAEELYGSDRSVAGRQLRLSGRTYTIVGIMPESFVFLDPDVRLWVPDAFTAEQRQAYHSNSWNMIARLQPGVTLEQAQQRVDALNEANLDVIPGLRDALINAGFHTPVAYFQQDMVREVRGTLFLLWGGVLFVLLIGCVNLANLVLVRSSAQTKELATRFALGAGRWRIIRQMLTESILINTLGGLCGLFLGWGGLRALATLGMEELPRGAEIALDGAAVAWTAALAVTIGVVLGLIPLISGVRVNLTSAFREEGRSGTAGRSARLLRDGLVVAQVAFALILLVGAGLLLASFRQVLSVDPGFDPEGVISATVAPPSARYEDDEAILAFADEVLRSAGGIPGVVEASITSAIPFGGSYGDSVILAEGYVPAPGESLVSPDRTRVSARYFETLGIPLLEGRTFDITDTEEALPTIIIDERLARHFWPDGDALGKRLYQPASIDDLFNMTGARVMTVVGIVGNVRRSTLEDLGELDVGAYYLPMKQNPIRGMDIAIKVSGDPTAVVSPLRAAIAEIDPELPIFDIRTLQERIDESLRSRRSPMMLALVFAGVALFLASVGIYGVLAYLVSLRTREIGIRIALGSDSRRVFGLVAREGIVIVGIGFVLGLAGALALQRAIESQLFGVSATNPLVLGAVLALLAVVALIACAIPARRATRIDPVVALTAE